MSDERPITLQELLEEGCGWALDKLCGRIPERFRPSRNVRFVIARRAAESIESGLSRRLSRPLEEPAEEPAEEPEDDAIVMEPDENGTYGERREP